MSIRNVTECFVAHKLVTFVLLLIYQIRITESSGIRFALITKNIDDPYFHDVLFGCQDKSKELGVECVPLGPDDNTENILLNQTQTIRDLIEEGSFHGITIAAADSIALIDPINAAIDAGISVVTHDNDVPDSKRMAYIGTNNTAFGDVLGKVLVQIAPEGGKYGIISASGHTNLDQRVAGIRQRLSSWKSNWEEVALLNASDKEFTSSSLELMRQLAKNPEIKAILTCCGWPMYDTVEWKKFVNENKHLVLINGDSNNVQLNLLNQAYGDGLVGQLPYEMGSLSIEKLLKLTQGGDVNEQSFGTRLLQHLRIPLNLPELKVNSNNLGSLIIFGFFMFAVNATLSIGFGIWVYINRKHPIVTASQPVFLYCFCLGTFIMGSTIIPLSVDDENASEEIASKACRSAPWLGFIGFTIIFSMLFSKTWRINKIFHNAQNFNRVKVEPRDVIVPFILLLFANIIVLTCWTVLAPMSYVRKPLPGTDDWNRVIATYGECSSPNTKTLSYPIILNVLNVLVIIMANYQAYRARSITTAYSESKYIGLSLLFITQAIVIGVPVVVMSFKNPRVLYVSITSIVSLVCISLQLILFVPKIRLKRKPNSETKTRISFKQSFASNFSKSVGRLSFIGQGKQPSPLPSVIHRSNVPEVVSNIIQDDFPRDSSNAFSLGTNEMDMTTDVDSNGNVNENKKEIETKGAVNESTTEIESNGNINKITSETESNVLRFGDTVDSFTVSGRQEIIADLPTQCLENEQNADT